eukprot:12415385-Karenia_brevis.AAC.1
MLLRNTGRAFTSLRAHDVGIVLLPGPAVPGLMSPVRTLTVEGAAAPPPLCQRMLSPSSPLMSPHLVNVTSQL